MRRAALVTLLAAWLLSMSCAAQTAAQRNADALQPPIGGDSQYTLALGGPMGPSWSSSNEVWYKRNRRIAIVGKVLTVLGLTLVVSQVRSRHQGLVLGGLGTQYLGQLIWSAAELRGANELRRRGFRLSNTAAIVALCGALLVSPLTWIAGPIESAQIRQAHANMTLGQSSAASFTSYGLGFRGNF
jgi:hypothetical protein